MEDSMTVSNGKYILEVYRDEYADSPREDDNFGKMVCWHRRYNLGDKHDFDSPQDFLESEEYKNAYAVLPIYLYDHSGITISNTDFGDRWDSGQVGYIYVTKQDVENMYGKNPSEAIETLIHERLIAETEMYDHYLQGDCFAFRITDEEGVYEDGCAGFYGDDIAKVLGEMRETVDLPFEGLFDKMQKHSAAYTAMM